MTWDELTDAIFEVLKEVEYGDPPVKLAGFYPEPPEQIQDVPAAILLDESVSVMRASMLRTKTYSLAIRLLIADENVGDAIRQARLFREAMIDAFDKAVTLRTPGGRIHGPDFGRITGFDYGGRRVIGTDASLTVIVNETREFEA